jgi:simple sugar transport system substrate-binding protein
VLNLEKGNASLDLRCSEFALALRRHGATSRDLAINLDDAATTERLLTAVFRSNAVDGALALWSAGAEAALAALRNVRRVGKVKLWTFDLSPRVLAAVRAGELLFTIDQQPYLQGYLPIVFLSQLARHGLMRPRGGESRRARTSSRRPPRRRPSGSTVARSAERTVDLLAGR